MKPIYKSLVLTNMALAVTLSLQANVTSDGASTPQAVNADTLEGLKVTLVSPNVSGARDLIASGECITSENELHIVLDGSKLTQGATHRILVQMEYGTNTVVLYGLNVTVPRYATLEPDTQEYEDNVVVVSTFGDGAGGGGADADVYSKDDSDNAHITTPLSIGGGVANSDCSIAAGYTTDEVGGSVVSTSGDGSIAVGSANAAGSSIITNAEGAVAVGMIDGQGSTISAQGGGSIAAGAITNNGNISTSGGGAVAIGFISGSENAAGLISASGKGSLARGVARYGKLEATGEGATVIGQAAEGSIKATGDGSFAGGCTIVYGDKIEAAGAASFAFGKEVAAQATCAQAFGYETTARMAAQMVCGQNNVSDSTEYQFIVGNGADAEHQSNAFAALKSGGIALFKADGTAVTLTATQLEALIALLQNA